MMPSPLVKSETAAGHRRGGDEGTPVASRAGIISANPFDRQSVDHESCGGTPSDRASETLEATVSEGPAHRYATGDAGTAPTGSLATALTDVASRCEPGPQDTIAEQRIAALEADLAELKANLKDGLTELLARIEAGEGR